MSEVEAICDRIIIIDKGRIVANKITSEIHAASKENFITFVVEFDSKISVDKIKKIENINEVVSVSETHFIVQSEIDIRKKLFDFAVANKIAVLSMQKKEKSLEEIFQELTK